MTNILHVLYDSSIETEETLSKFSKILTLAGFKEENIKNISLEEYRTYLLQNDYNFHKFVLCINHTYKDINTLYSDKLDVAIFDFFSKEYVNTEKGLILFGLLFSINDIHEVPYKRFAWNLIQRLYEQYFKIVNNQTEDEADFCDYLSQPSENEIITEDVPQVLTVEKEEVEVEKKHNIIVDEVTEEIQSPTYDELLSFYNNTKSFIAQFNLIQQQTKIIESYNNDASI